MCWSCVTSVATQMVEGPANTELEYYKDVVFTCKGKADDSTPVEYDWLWEGRDVVYQEGRVQQDEDGSLRLITKNEDDGGKSFEGNYTCVATNGYSSVRASAVLETPVGPARE